LKAVTGEESEGSQTVDERAVRVRRVLASDWEEDEEDSKPRSVEERVGWLSLVEIMANPLAEKEDAPETRPARKVVDNEEEEARDEIFPMRSELAEAQDEEAMS
jgi:hypothetical protein